MTPPDFDTLSLTANAEQASRDDKSRLYAAVFGLEQWHFIARGDFPDVHPYLASNPTVVDGAAMVKAFTDTRKLQAFAEQNRLVAPDGSALILSLPVASILPVLASYAEQGVWGIHFNADADSHGFYAPLVQMPIIRQYLEDTGAL